MAKKKKNLSEIDFQIADSLRNEQIGIIVSEWNHDVTESMRQACISILIEAGVKKKKKLMTLRVPGSFELPAAAKILIESKKMDAVICLGCIIQGETRHFDFISEAVANGIMDLNIRYNVPIIFGVLTTENMEQALNRAGGKQGNKGTEAAVTAIKMIALKKQLAR